MQSPNVFRALLDMLPDEPRLVGTVTTVHTDGSGTVTVTLVGGGTMRVRGTSAEGTQVFIKGGLVESEAPTLTNWTIEV